MGWFSLLECNRVKHSASLTAFCSNLYAVFLHRDMMIRGILLAAWVVQKQPIAKICLSWGDGGNMYKSNDYQKFAGVSDWIQINWSQRTGNKAISRSSSDPFWYPEICSPLSPLALAISSSLDITEAWTLYFTRWIWGTSHFPIFSFGTFLHNKAFFTPNSDILRFGLSNCQAYPLDWS